MKLIIILGVKEEQDKLQTVLAGSVVKVFSKLDILGYITDENTNLKQLLTNQLDASYSFAAFTFVQDKEVGQEIINQIRILNKSSNLKNPFHAYQIDVEQFC